MSKEKSLTKGQELEVHRKQIEKLQEGQMQLAGQLSMNQQGIQMLMHSVDGQKLMLNSLTNLLQGVLADKLEISKESFDKLLEENFQKELDKYRAELEEAMKRQEAENSAVSVTDELVGDSEETTESEDEVSLGNLLQFPTQD